MTPAEMANRCFERWGYIVICQLDPSAPRKIQPGSIVDNICTLEGQPFYVTAPATFEEFYEQWAWLRSQDSRVPELDMEAWSRQLFWKAITE